MCFVLSKLHFLVVNVPEHNSTLPNQLICWTRSVVFYQNFHAGLFPRSRCHFEKSERKYIYMHYMKIVFDFSTIELLHLASVCVSVCVNKYHKACNNNVISAKGIFGGGGGL